MPVPRIATEEEKNLIIENLRYDPSSGNIYWIKQRSRAKIGDVAATSTTAGYLVFTIGGRLYKVHRAAWFLYYREWPTKEIDHINGIKSDNRISNLRQATRSENQHNRKRHRAGDHVGVYKDTGSKSGWVASAPRNFLKRRAADSKYIGYYKTKKDAIRAVIDYCKNNED